MSERMPERNVKAIKVKCIVRWVNGRHLPGHQLTCTLCLDSTRCDKRNSMTRTHSSTASSCKPPHKERQLPQVHRTKHIISRSDTQRRKGMRCHPLAAFICQASQHFMCTASMVCEYIHTAPISLCISRSGGQPPVLLRQSFVRS